VEHPSQAKQSAWSQVSPARTLKPFIHRAVLIDGGDKVGAGYIRNFLWNRVGQLYDFDDRREGGPLTFPPFHSILITHWDSDHVGFSSFKSHDKLIYIESVLTSS